MQILQLMFRALQFIFTVVVIGLSAELVKGQLIGKVPAINDYILFLGIWGFLVFVVGSVAVFASSLQGLIMAGLDGLAVLFYIAGGVAMAVKLGVNSCDANKAYGQNKAWINQIVNAGLIGPCEDDAKETCTFKQTDYYNPFPVYTSRCRIAQADTAFVFFALAAFLASLAHDLLSVRGKSSSHV